MDIKTADQEDDAVLPVSPFLVLLPALAICTVTVGLVVIPVCLGQPTDVMVGNGIDDSPSSQRVRQSPKRTEPARSDDGGGWLQVGERGIIEVCILP